MLVLLLQARERTALQGVIFYISDASFNLAFVPRCVRFCGQDDCAIMFAKRLDLGLDVRIIPVSLLYRCLEIVDNQSLGNAAEVPEGILQAAYEVLGGLTINYFAVGLARETQDNPKDMRAFAFAIRPDDRCACAKVNLCLLAWHTFHPAKRYWLARAEALYKPANTVIAAAKAVLIDQILMNPLARQPLLELVFDGLLEGLANALWARCNGNIVGRPGGRVSGGLP